MQIVRHSHLFYVIALFAHGKNITITHKIVKMFI